MNVAPNSTDVSTYFCLRKAADGTELTGATITNIDLVYTRSGADHAVKVDATALATPDAAHADNKAIEVDATSAPGLYRVDWPDAAFAEGAREVILTVIYATAFTEHLRVELSPWLTPVTGATVLADTTAIAPGAINAAAIATGAIDADALASDAAGEIADAVWDEALAGHTAAGSTGKQLSDAGAAGDPWAAAVRTLTQSAASVAAAVSGSKIVVMRGDTWTMALTGLGNIASRSKLWFTARGRKDDPDSASLLQIEETAGLLYLSGRPGTPTDGSLVVNDETAGNITITVKPNDAGIASAYYDVQMLTVLGTVQTLTTGTFEVVADVTRAIS